MEFIKEFFGYFMGGEVLRKLLSNLGGMLSEKVAAEAAHRLPLFLGLSKDDERIWGKLWSQLSSAERILITNFLDSLEDFQKNSFRYVVVGIPDEKKKEIKTVSGDKTTTENENLSFALKFLKTMAKVIKDNGVDEANRQCLAGGIITSDTFSQKMIEKWRDFVRWFQDNGIEKIQIYILNFFCVDKLSEITPELIARKAISLDKQIASSIPRIKRPGFFEVIFGSKRR